VADSWMSLTRRRMLGAAFFGGGTLLSRCGFGSTGRRLQTHGRYLLDRIPSCPPGLRDAVRFPLVEALHGRRARRFGLGCTIPDGPLAHQSRHEPVPLTELEQMLLLTSIAGNTGWQYLIPHNDRYLPDIPNYAGAAGGRTFPSAGGIHTLEFFYTDDNGTYFLPTRDAPSLLPTDSGSDVDLNDYLAAHRERIRKLSDQRLHIPQSPAHMEMHNAWCANRPGSTLVIPVADAAQHGIANLCYWVQNRVCLFDDICGNEIPGIEKYRDLVDVDQPLPLSFAEQILTAELSAEVSTACYAGMLMLQALGLGGWLYGGINPFSVLGASGDPEVPGLGFHFQTDDRWPLPNVTGLPGVLEGFCPPHYAAMRDAVEAFVDRKYGPGGPFHPDTPGPYRETSRVRGSAAPHHPHFVDCVTTMATYIYETYGRFPATMSPMFILTYLQAHHLDLDFYDHHFQDGAYLRTHADHMRQWHGQA